MRDQEVLGLYEAYQQVYEPTETTEPDLLEFETWVNELVQEGYDLSEYTWDEMYEVYNNNLQESVDEFDDSFPDYYDYILEHLISEGYAETVEDALTIMVNMSEDWRLQIIDEANRGDEYEASKMHPNEAKLAKQNRRNASYDGGYTHIGAERYTDSQKQQLDKYETGGASRHTTLRRQRANRLTRGIKGKNR